MAEVKFNWKGEEVSIKMRRAWVDELSRVVIDNKPERIRFSFPFVESPQGEKYWWNRADAQVPLSAEDRLFLIMLLKHSLYLKEE